MISWRTVSRWNTDPALEAQYSIERAEGAMQANGDVLFRARANFSSTGLTATAARNSLTEVLKDIDFVEAQLTDLLIATRDATVTLNEIVNRVNGAQNYALDEHLVLHADGSIEIGAQVWEDARAEAAMMPQPLPDVNGNLHPPALETTSAYWRAATAKRNLEREIDTILAMAQALDDSLTTACENITNSVASDQSKELSSDSFSAEMFTKHLTPDKSPAEIRALWDSLSPAQQSMIELRYPFIVGSTNGIPFSTRSRINEQLAADRSKGLTEQIDAIQEKMDNLAPNIEFNALEYNLLYSKKESLIREREYLDQVTNSPERTFILFDPDSNRIIEQNGSLTASTTEVYTHVPGTGTSYKSFQDGSATAFPASIVETARELYPNTVVSSFTFMDGNFEGEGAWIEWGTGERGNANANHLQAKGESLNSFQDAVAVEAANIGADINIGGHSAGQSVVFSSESFGAWYDQVNSLSGSYAPGDWKLNASTSYDHYYYKPEPLNMFGIGSAPSPMNVDAFEKHAYDGTDPLANHTRTNTDLTNNRPLIEDLIHEIQSN